MRSWALILLLSSASWGAVSSKVGSFSLNTSAGNQAITGVGFQPKALLFWGAGTQTVSGSQANARIMFGMATDSTHRGVLWGGQDNGVSPANPSMDWQFSRCISFYAPNGGTPTLDAVADFVSMDAGGFTINVTTGDGVAYVVNYLALGGSSITNIQVSSFTVTNTTGLKSVNQLPFAPDAVIYLNNSRKAAFAVSLPAEMGISFSDGVSTSAVAFETANAATSVSNTYQRALKSIVGFNSGVLNEEATHVSFDAGGITDNYTTAPGGSRIIIYMAMKGASVANGVFNQPTSNGNSSVTGLSFRPAAVLFASGNKATSSSVSAHARFSIGAMDENGAQNSVWYGDKNGVATTVTNSDLDTTKTIKMMTEGTPTVDASATYSAMNSDGFTITWGATDATAREIIYWAIGPGTAPATTTTPANRGLKINGGKLSVIGGKLSVL